MQYWFLLLLKLGICFCVMRHRLLPIWASLCIADTQSKPSSQQSLPTGESMNPGHSVLHILDHSECISSRVVYPQSLDVSCTPTILGIAADCEYLRGFALGPRGPAAFLPLTCIATVKPQGLLDLAGPLLYTATHNLHTSLVVQRVY